MSSFSLLDNELSYGGMDDMLDEYSSTPSSETAAPVVAQSSAGQQTQNQQPSVIQQALAGGAASAIAGIGQGLGSALQYAFMPNQPQYVPVTTNSSMLPMLLIVGVGALGLLFVLKKK